MSDIPYEDNANLIAYKVRQLAKTASELIKWQKHVDKTLDDHWNEIENITEGFKELKNEMKGMRKTLLGLAFSIAGSSVVFALSILTATGKL